MMAHSTTLKSQAILALSILTSTLFIVGAQKAEALIAAPQGCVFPTGSIASLDGLELVKIYEKSGTVADFSITANDPRLLQDSNQTTNPDFTTVDQEKYDVFYSNAFGTKDEQGSYLTIQIDANGGTSTDVHSNIDAVELRLGNGQKFYADSVANTVLGKDVVVSSIQHAIGSPNDSATKLGNSTASITLGFCETLQTKADIAVSIKDTPAQYEVGTTANITVEVVNNGPDTAKNTQIAFDIPAGWTSANNGCTTNNQRTFCPIGDLAKDQKDEFVLSFSIPDDKNLCNKGEEIDIDVISDSITDTTPSNNNTTTFVQTQECAAECSDNKDNDNDGTSDFRLVCPSCTPNTPPELCKCFNGGDLGCSGPDDDDESDDPIHADLSIDVQASSDITSQGEQLVYSYKVKNNGPNDANDVVVSSSLPAHITFMSSSFNGCTKQPSDPNHVVCIIENLQKNNTTEFTVTVKVNEHKDFPCSEQLINYSHVQSPTILDNRPFNNFSNSHVDVACLPVEEPVADLSLTKTGPNTAYPGTKIRYRITIDNPTSSTVNFTEFVDTPDTKLTLTNQFSNVGDCELDANDEIICKNIPVKPFSTEKVELEFLIDQNASCNSTITNSAIITNASLADNNLTNNTDAVETLVVCAACQDGIDNDNDGLIDLHDPGCDSIHDNSEKSIQYACDNGIDDDQDGLIDFQIQGGDQNCSSPFDQDETGSTSLNDYLEVTKTGPSEIVSNTTASFTIKVKNTSNTTLKNVKITDDIYTFISVVPGVNQYSGYTFLENQSSGECNHSPVTNRGTRVVCTQSELGPNQEKIFTLVYDLPSYFCTDETLKNYVIVEADNTKSVTDNYSKLPTCNGGGSSSSSSNTTSSGGSSSSSSTTTSGSSSSSSSTTTSGSSSSSSTSIITTLNISDTKDPVSREEEFAYTIVVQNLSNEAIVKDFVTLELNQHLEFISANPSNTSKNGNTITWNNLAIATNGSISLTANVRLQNTAPEGSVINSTVSCSSDQDSEATTIRETVTTSDDDANIRIKDDRDPAEPGEIVTYTITIENNTDQDDEFDVYAQLDDHLSFISATNGGDEEDEDEVRWEDIEVDAYDTKKLSLRARVRSNDPRSVVRVEVELNNGLATDVERTEVRKRTNWTHNRSQRQIVINQRGSSRNVVVQRDDYYRRLQGREFMNYFDQPIFFEGPVEADIAINASAGEMQPGSIVNYQVTVRNLGGETARSVHIRSGFDPRSLDIVNPGEGIMHADHIAWFLPQLNPNETYVFEYTARAMPTLNHGSIVVNAVDMNSPDFERPASDAVEVHVINQLPQTGNSGFAKAITKQSKHVVANTKVTTTTTKNHMNPMTFFVTITMMGVIAGGMSARRFLF